MGKVYLVQIGIVEIAASLSKKVRTKELIQDDYEATLEIFLEDVQDGEYIIVSLSDQVVEVAVDLTRTHPLRGYDAVHLASTIILNATLVDAGMPSLIFICADEVLCEATRGEGLYADNPH